MFLRQEKQIEPQHEAQILKQKPLSDLELALATEIAIESMGSVDGVINIHLLPPKFMIEPTVMGFGVVSATVNKQFVLQNMNANSNSMKEAFEEFLENQPEDTELKDCLWQIHFKKVGGMFNHHYVAASVLSIGGNQWQIGFLDKIKTIPQLFNSICMNTNQPQTQYEKTQDFALEQTSKFNWPLITFVIGGGLLFLFLGEGSPIIAIFIVLVAMLFKYVINRDDPIQPSYKDDATIEAERMAKTKPVNESKTFKAGVQSAKAIAEAKKKLQKVSAKVTKEDSHPCPICAETIKKNAKKCRHCGEWLEAKL